jgi:uncharacterized membrane protein YfcA
MQIVIATSLATVVCSSLCASIFLYFKKTPHWMFAIRLAPGLILGAYLGSKLNHVFNTEYLKNIFGIFMVCQGSYMIYVAYDSRAKQIQKQYRIAWSWILLLGVGIGSLSGLIGLGGGVFLVPLLMYMGFSIREASATSLVSMVPTVLTGALSAMYFGWGNQDLPAKCLGYIYWPAAVTMGAISMCTAPLGVHLAQKLPVNTLKKALGFIVVLTGLLMLK